MCEYELVQIVAELQRVLPVLPCSAAMSEQFPIWFSGALNDPAGILSRDVCRKICSGYLRLAKSGYEKYKQKWESLGRNVGSIRIYLANYATNVRLYYMCYFLHSPIQGVSE